MAFKFTTTETLNTERVTPGEYEVTISKFEGNTNDNGKKRLNIEYTVRQDVYQEHAGAKIFGDIYPTAEGFKEWQIGPLANAIGEQIHLGAQNFPENPQDPTKVPGEAIKFLLAYARNTKLKVKVGEQTYNGKTYAKIIAYDKPSSLMMPGNGFVDDPNPYAGTWTPGGGAVETPQAPNQPTPAQLASVAQQAQNGLAINDEDLPF